MREQTFANFAKNREIAKVSSFKVSEFFIYLSYITHKTINEDFYNFFFAVVDMKIYLYFYRAATIVAASEGIIWALDRLTFRKILLKAAYNKVNNGESLMLHYIPCHYTAVEQYSVILLYNFTEYSVILCNFTGLDHTVISKFRIFWCL